MDFGQEPTGSGSDGLDLRSTLAEGDLFMQLLVAAKEDVGMGATLRVTSGAGNGARLVVTFPAVTNEGPGGAGALVRP